RRAMISRGLRKGGNNFNDSNEVHHLDSMKDNKEREELHRPSRKMSIFNKLKPSYGSKHQAPAPINVEAAITSTLPTPPATPAKTGEVPEVIATTTTTTNKETHLRDT